MIVSKGKLKEQIQILYSQFIGKDKFDDNIDKRVIDSLLDQVIAKYIKVQTLENFKVGTIELPSVFMVEYTISATSNKLDLPIYPVSLPFDMGIWSVSDGTNPPYIPIPNVYMSTMAGTVTQNLEGQTGYTVMNMTIKFTKAVTGPQKVVLLTTDFGLFSDTELLPLNPEIQSDIINDVLSIISNGQFSQKELNYDADKNRK